MIGSSRRLKFPLVGPQICQKKSFLALVSTIHALGLMADDATAISRERERMLLRACQSPHEIQQRYI